MLQASARWAVGGSGKRQPLINPIKTRAGTDAGFFSARKEDARAPGFTPVFRFDTPLGADLSDSAVDQDM